MRVNILARRKATCCRCCHRCYCWEGRCRWKIPCPSCCMCYHYRSSSSSSRCCSSLESVLVTVSECTGERTTSAATLTTRLPSEQNQIILTVVGTSAARVRASRRVVVVSLAVGSGSVRHGKVKVLNEVASLGQKKWSAEKNEGVNNAESKDLKLKA